MASVSRKENMKQVKYSLHRCVDPTFARRLNVQVLFPQMLYGPLFLNHQVCWRRARSAGQNIKIWTNIEIEIE